MDWREKLKATRKGSKKTPSGVSSPEAASPAAPSQAATSPPQPAEAAELGATSRVAGHVGQEHRGHLLWQPEVKGALLSTSAPRSYQQDLTLEKESAV